MREPAGDPIAEPRLEGAIRAALAIDRPSGGVPASLRARIAAIPARNESGPRAWLGRRPVLGLAAIGGVAAATVLLLITGLGPLQDLHDAGGPAATTAPTFDPSLEAQGILADVAPTLQWIPALVALAAGGSAAWIGLRSLRRPTGRRRSTAVAILLAALAAGSVALSQEPGFEWRGGSYGPVVGFDVVQPPGPGSANVPTYYDTAEPGGPIAMVVDVTNPGLLPIRLEGLVVRVPSNAGGPHWTSLALARNPNEYPNQLESLVPFHPVDVPAGGFVALYLIGKAGTCAYGPSFQLGASDTGGFVTRTPDRRIELAYSVFGLERSGVFTLPFEVVEAYAPGCSG